MDGGGVEAENDDLAFTGENGVAGASAARRENKEKRLSLQEGPIYRGRCV